MATASISLNPSLTTNATGLFSKTTYGLVQGTVYDNAAYRNYLDGGILATDETIPMWGGVGIYENVPLSTAGSTTASPTLGGNVGRATSVTAAAAKSLTGFSVFNQAHSWIATPQSRVPLAASGQSVPFFRLGSGAKLAVQCAAELVNNDGTIITSQISWDFTNQLLVPYSPAYSNATITGAVWANTSGGQTTFTVGTDLTSNLNAGDSIEVTGVVNTGGTSTSAYNGRWVVVSVTSSTIVVTQPASASPGTYASGGTVLAGGGALSVKLTQVQIGGCLTVTYDPVTGFANWNPNGNCAVILI